MRSWFEAVLINSTSIVVETPTPRFHTHGQTKLVDDWLRLNGSQLLVMLLFKHTGDLPGIEIGGCQLRPIQSANCQRH